MKFVLASASPARKRLLDSAGIDSLVVAGSFDEEAVPFVEPESYVSTLSQGKAMNVLAQTSRLPQGEFFLLACDSVLMFEGTVHGKPAGPEQAVSRWQSMRGKSGQLYTGHVLVKARHDGSVMTSSPAGRVVMTKVYFAEASDDEIRAYVATEEPLRCAGAFALEGFGGLFVERLDGCHSNVIGLSLPALRSMLLELGRSPVSFWGTA